MNGRVFAIGGGRNTAKPGSRLFRYFLIVSICSLVAIVVASGLGLRMVLRGFVLHEAEKDAIRISTAIRDSQIVRFIPTNLSEGALLTISQKDLARLDREMRAFLVPFDIVKIKVFNRETRIVYSTDPKIIGRLDLDNTKLAVSLKGLPISKYETPKHVWDLADKERSNVHIVESYVPIRGHRGKIVGSFEVYKDVTGDLALADTTLIRQALVLSVIVLGVFAVLIFIVYRVARRIDSADAALQQSEEKYRQLFSTESDGILIFDAETKEFVDVNEAALQLYGYRKDEFLTLTVADTTAGPGEVHGSLRNSDSGKGELTSVHYHKKKDGTVFPVEVSPGSFAVGDRKVMFEVVRDITERKRTEEAVSKYQGQLRSLASELDWAERRERRRIAAFLHDYVGQGLALVKMQLNELTEPGTSGELGASLKKIGTTIDQMIRNTQSVVSHLNPPVLRELGFEAAIEWLTQYELGFEGVVEWLVDRRHSRHGLGVTFEDDQKHKPLNENVSRVLFRAVRELLINVAKHARAENVKVSVRRAEPNVRVEVEDDGVGFDAGEVRSRKDLSAGFGLFNIRERLDQLGGSLEVYSQPGLGTRVILEAPLRLAEGSQG